MASLMLLHSDDICFLFLESSKFLWCSSTSTSLFLMQLLLDAEGTLSFFVFLLGCGLLVLALLSDAVVFYSSHTEELNVDKIILSWIFSTLSDALQKRLVVARPKTAKEAWTFINDLVKDNKRSRTSALKTELRSIKLGDLTMEAYFQKIKSIITILASIDSPVNDEDVIHYAFEGLPEKYNQVCGYMHYKDTFLDLKMARSLLITKEMRLKSKALSLTVDSSSPMGMGVRLQHVTSDRAVFCHLPLERDGLTSHFFSLLLMILKNHAAKETLSSQRNIVLISCFVVTMLK
ncbi:ribonuclease H-like domain-containing protein [Tanacetum coccineum]